ARHANGRRSRRSALCAQLRRTLGDWHACNGAQGSSRNRSLSRSRYYLNNPPFHAEHIGSFVRPPRLIEAARARKNNSLSEEQFRQVQDDAIREIVAFQESIGLPSITDGEFRRRSWSAGFIDAV